LYNKNNIFYSPLNLAKLTEICHTIINSIFSISPYKQYLPSLELPQLICQNAERKLYGIESKDSIIYEDESPDASWTWEIQNILLLPA
jgi:hypothetical protein